MASIVSALRNSWEKNWPEFHAAAAGGLPQFMLARRPSALGPRIPVFCYHVVNAGQFETDLNFLSRNRYVTIQADSLLDHLEERRQAPERAVVLTIDDGARNLYEVAFPLLHRYGMKAVAFLAPRFHVEHYNRPCDSKTGLPPPLTWSQIREMHASGIIDFQSHTYEHRYLPRWPEPADLEGSDPDFVHSFRGLGMTIWQDFRLSKETLEQQLGKPVRHLAFPRFNGTEEALRVGHECGYKAFWWGVLPHRPDNKPGDSPSFIVRVDRRYLRRLPGNGRESLTTILCARYGKSISRRLNCFRGRERSRLECHREQKV